MRQRQFGRTGLQIAELSFGCGSVGGLMVRGARADRVRAIARAIEAGVTYFDTAHAYGDGMSETNLGEVLRELNPRITVGTKIRVSQSELPNARAVIRAKVQAGLDRLGLPSVDVLYLHNQISESGSADDGVLSADQVLGPVLEGFNDLKAAGLIRNLGFTGLGDTAGVIKVVDSGAFDVMHTYFNALNPSAAHPVPASFGAQNLGQMMDRAVARGMGIIAIRILAAGALAGVAPDERGALAGPVGGSLTAGGDYGSDLARTAKLRPIAAELGISLAELAIRFAITEQRVSSALIGMATVDQFESAVQAVEGGPLPEAVFKRMLELAA
ncbi:MAG: aldo/keto reductase [Chloroflexota bacterium]